MKKLFLLLVIALAAVFLSVSSVFAVQAVTIVKPANNADVGESVEVCMDVKGVTVEPAKKGVNDGKGHHHLLIDVDLPKDLSKPIGKDTNHVHMGDGSTCKKLSLSHGKHTIRALFAKGNHVPYNPAISATITVNVK